MQVRKLVSNALVAFLAQGVSLTLSVLTSLLVPKILGIEEFGYWQLFIFYTSYAGLFHLGLNDGVYLLNGGRHRNELDSRSIKGQFAVGTLFQLICAALIFLGALSGGFGEKRSAVLMLTAIYMVLTNAAAFLGYVFQAINETKLFSFSVIIDKLVFLVPLCVLLICRVRTFEWYAIFYAVSKTCAFVYCLWRAKDILAVKAYSLSQSAQLSWNSIRVGIKLMIANLASLLILGVARFVIDYKWGIKVFGKLSFSLALVNFFIQFVSQASMVLFPALRQSNREELTNVYRHIRDVMELVFPFIYLLYFPIVWIISKWLPAYASSLDYFILLMPLCLFNTKMDICCTTYFKVLRREKLLLIINLATVALSSVCVFIFAFLKPSVYLIIGSVVVAIILRSFVSEMLVNRQLYVKSSILSVEEIMITIIFIAVAFMLPGWWAAGIYAIVYAVYLLINRRACKDMISVFKRAFSQK
ncbi:oligosaccharide flippase family protein [Bifidobacterium sp. ESL0704]|uniref:lipopolysaccharide biosynthesis protein n=1 Tax=Bifidobacterium sp. ESL0704 TaxID=2983219 RepID=UPI0023F7795D|nr:oligosaccharide flippase family protein [Bifidobacterium sp. ESL0704]WEV52726.1 oligosaccharide flippase family protein [Bifidobacterium sp. ESL0704]